MNDLLGPPMDEDDLRRRFATQVEGLVPREGLAERARRAGRRRRHLTAAGGGVTAAALALGLVTLTGIGASGTGGGRVSAAAAPVRPAVTAPASADPTPVPTGTTEVADGQASADDGFRLELDPTLDHHAYANGTVGRWALTLLPWHLEAKEGDRVRRLPGGGVESRQVYVPDEAAGRDVHPVLGDPSKRSVVATARDLASTAPRALQDAVDAAVASLPTGATARGAVDGRPAAVVEVGDRRTLVLAVVHAGHAQLLTLAARGDVTWGELADAVTNLRPRVAQDRFGARI